MITLSSHFLLLATIFFECKQKEFLFLSVGVSVLRVLPTHHHQHHEAQKHSL